MSALPNIHENTESHVLAVIVRNEPGVLARVVNMFTARGYNIDSLTVAEVDGNRKLSRITVVAHGTPLIVEQIKRQLARLIPVVNVADLTETGPFVAREMALVKVAGKDEKRVETLRIAEIFRARVVDSTLDSFIFEITGAPEKIEAFIDQMKPLGLVNLARTGAAALLRGRSSLLNTEEEQK